MKRREALFNGICCGTAGLFGLVLTFALTMQYFTADKEELGEIGYEDFRRTYFEGSELSTVGLVLMSVIALGMSYFFIAASRKD